MTKKIWCVRILSLLVCVLMLSGLLVLVTGASDDAYVPMEWTLDEDLKFIDGSNGVRYERYYVGGAFYGDARRVFYFANKVLYEDRYCQVYGDALDPHIVSVRTESGYSTIFTDAQGKRILDDFLAGIDCIWYLEDYGNVYTEISEDLARELRDAYTAENASLKWVSVNELAEAEIYEITAHDKTELKAYQHGAVYLMDDGSYYYVCFRVLDNSYFDADGYFSYRSGNVQVYELTKAERTEINWLLTEMIPKESTAVYEEDVLNGYYDIYGNPIDDGLDLLADPAYRQGMIVIFYVLTVVIGMLLPLILLILGIALANVPKTGKAKCWYALSASALLWLLSAGVFLLLVVL